MQEMPPALIPAMHEAHALPLTYIPDPPRLVADDAVVLETPSDWPEVLLLTFFTPDHQDRRFTSLYLAAFSSPCFSPHEVAAAWVLCVRLIVSVHVRASVRNVCGNYLFIQGCS